MQKKHKSHKHKLRAASNTKVETKVEKKTEAEKKTSKKESEQEVLESIEYPDNGVQIIFNIFDTYRNNTMYYQEWLRFLKFSFLYS